MNPTQLRILFDAWLGSRHDSATFARLIPELVEAGGLPKPDVADLLEARENLRVATEVQKIFDPRHETDAQAVIRNHMARYEALAAEWTVNP